MYFHLFGFTIGNMKILDLYNTCIFKLYFSYSEVCTFSLQIKGFVHSVPQTIIKLVHVRRPRVTTLMYVIYFVSNPNKLDIFLQGVIFLPD